MQYKLENKNGMVEFVMDSGKDLVMGNMNECDVRKLLSEIPAEESELKSYPVRVGMFRFKGEIIKDDRKPLPKGKH